MSRLHPAMATRSLYLLLWLFLGQQLAWADTSPMWIDVRSAQEYEAGHAPSAINIPHDEIAGKITSVSADKDAPIYLYCRSGTRAGIAKSALEAEGYTHVVNVGSLEQALKATQ